MIVRKEYPNYEEFKAARALLEGEAKWYTSFCDGGKGDFWIETKEATK